MNKDDIKTAMEASFKARKLVFPAEAFDTFLDMAAKKIHNAHTWRDSYASHTLTCAATEYHWELPSDYRAYATDTVFLESSSANHPLRIIDRNKFDKDYGDVSHYSSAIPRFAKIDRSGGLTYLYTNSPVGSAYTITFGYYKKYSSLDDLPDACEIPLLALVESLMIGPGSPQGWSIMGTYEDKLLPQAIAEDQEQLGSPDAFETEASRSGFNMQEGYGG